MSDSDISQTTHKYITTTLPYINGKPHLGHAFEFIRADAVARFKRLEGFEVFFNTGTDEHGQKVLKRAEEEGVSVEEFADTYSGKFKDLLAELNVSNDAFVRTTDESHKTAAQAFWKRCEENGDIYKKQYKGLYCVGCEMFVSEGDLNEDGECPDHTGQKPKEIEEENYFFRFSRYEDQLLELYESHPDFVVPDKRFNEIKRFVEGGLEDFSISRVAEKMPWGVPVPGDDSQVMYVWFDALSNYISTLGWPGDEENFNNFWNNGAPIQFCGKDNLRQQSAMWQAMLMSAGLNPTRQIVIHGHIQSDGRKMSKSVGNVIDPLEVIEEYSTDVLRYYLLRHLHPFDDPDMTMESLEEVYNGNLANGLGNLVSRIGYMYASYDVEVALDRDVETVIEEEDMQTLQELMHVYRFDRALDYIWAEVAHLDAFITENEPYKLIKSDDPDQVEEAKQAVAYLVLRLYDIAAMLTPFMPETAADIRKTLESGKKPEPLFLRRE
ncbi:MAG: methionine--tRNA ligase [Candidatus Paceibacterota bacterium]